MNGFICLHKLHHRSTHSSPGYVYSRPPDRQMTVGMNVFIGEVSVGRNNSLCIVVYKRHFSPQCSGEADVVLGCFWQQGVSVIVYTAETLLSHKWNLQTTYKQNHPAVYQLTKSVRIRVAHTCSPKI